MPLTRHLKAVLLLAVFFSSIGTAFGNPLKCESLYSNLERISGESTIRAKTRTLLELNRIWDFKRINTLRKNVSRQILELVEAVSVMRSNPGQWTVVARREYLVLEGVASNHLQKHVESNELWDARTRVRLNLLKIYLDEIIRNKDKPNFNSERYILLELSPPSLRISHQGFLNLKDGTRHFLLAIGRLSFVVSMRAIRGRI